MLSGAVSFTLLGALSARATDLSLVTKAPPPEPPAVDGFNGKVDGFGGSISGKTVYGGGATLSVPIQRAFGLQLDGSGGSLDGSGFGSVGGHLFWRDPRIGLIGLYGDYTNWNRLGGVRVAHVAGEGAYYFGQFTLEGIAGVEFGNSASSLTGASTTSTTTTAQAGAIPGVITTTSTGFFAVDSFNVKTRFFDQVDLAFYPIDNIKGYVGHRYLGGLNAAAFGGEVGLPLGRGIMGSAFVEARAGEHAFHGVWGGLKLYFGQSDKPLIARHRRDDPPTWLGDSLFGALNGQSSSSSPTSSSSSQQFCNPGSEFPVLIGGVCTFGEPSDVRLKRDIVPLGRLANGIGLYRYRYVGDDRLYVGVMAQEVARVVPDAVIRGGDGFLRVNYARLGLRLMSWEEWLGGAEAARAAA
jgi:hypothetical protein